MNDRNRRPLHIPDGPITRRQLLSRAAAAGVGFWTLPSILAACGGNESADGVGTGAGEGDVTLTFVSYGGAYQEAETAAWLNPFMEENAGIQIVNDGPTDYAKLQAMVESGNPTWNIVDVANDFGLDVHADLLEPLDCSVIPCDEMLPGLVGTYRVAVTVWGSVFAYRTDQFDGRVPGGWSDFFDLEAFPGKRGFWKFASGGLLEAALIADGVTQEELYPLDVDRALAKLDTIKDETIFWETGAESVQLLADGEITMGHAWNGRVWDIQQDGVPVEIQWNEHIQTANYLVVPKGVANLEETMRLIAYIVSAEHNANLSYEISYGPSNANAVDKTDPEKVPDLSTTYTDKAFFFDDEWWGDNFAEVDNQFQAWLQV